MSRYVQRLPRRVNHASAQHQTREQVWKSARIGLQEGKDASHRIASRRLVSRPGGCTVDHTKVQVQVLHCRPFTSLRFASRVDPLESIDPQRLTQSGW